MPPLQDLQMARRRCHLERRVAVTVGDSSQFQINIVVVVVLHNHHAMKDGPRGGASGHGRMMYGRVASFAVGRCFCGTSNHLLKDCSSVVLVGLEFLGQIFETNNISLVGRHGQRCHTFLVWLLLLWSCDRLRLGIDTNKSIKEWIQLTL